MNNFIAKHKKPAKKGTILFWRGVPKRSSIHTEMIIAAALMLRGYNVRFVFCDSMMAGCLQGGGVSRGRKRCNGCGASAINLLNRWGLPYTTFSQLVSSKKRSKFRRICDTLPRKKIASYVYQDIPVGRFAIGSLTRHLRGAPLNSSRYVMFREFLYSSLVCAEAAVVAAVRFNVTKLFIQNHLEYVGWGPAYYHFAGHKNTPATTWGGSLDNKKKNTFKNNTTLDYTPLHYVRENVWGKIKNSPLNDRQNKELNRLLDVKPLERDEILRRMGVKDNLPVWCLYPHTTWDVGLCPDEWPFKDVVDWLLITVKAMMDTPNINWVIKPHPGERHGTARGAKEIILSKYPNAEKYITILRPGVNLNSRTMSKAISGGMTLQGTCSVELACLGIPMIVGNGNYPGKEFVYGGKTLDVYLRLIHGVKGIGSLTDQQVKEARRYAYYVFMTRKLPMHMARGGGGYRSIHPAKYNLLLPGKDNVMDMICDRVVNGGEFRL